MGKSKLLWICGGVLMMAHCVQKLINPMSEGGLIAFLVVYVLGIALVSTAFVIDYNATKKKGMLAAAIIGYVIVVVRVLGIIAITGAFDALPLQVIYLILELPYYLLLFLPALAIVSYKENRWVKLFGWTFIAIWIVNTVIIILCHSMTSTVEQIDLYMSLMKACGIIEAIKAVILGITFIFVGLTDKFRE